MKNENYISAGEGIFAIIVIIILGWVVYKYHHKPVEVMPDPQVPVTLQQAE